MPFSRRRFSKRRKTATNKSRKSFGRRRSYRKRSSIPSLRSTTSGGFPKQKIVKLRYNETIQLNAPLAGVGAYVVSANSLYDPNTTGVGHQPMGYDLWATVYNHYTVIGSRIRATFALSGATSASLALGVCLDDDGGISGMNPSKLIERGDSTYRIVNDSYSQSRPMNITKGFSAKKWFGISNIKDNMTRVGANFGTSPSDSAHFVMWLASTTGGDDPAVCTITYTVEYLAFLSEPRDMDQS